MASLTVDRTYIPYDDSKALQPATAGRRAVKPLEPTAAKVVAAVAGIRVSAAELMRAQKMSVTVKSSKEETVAALNEEKRRLAQMSSERVKNWSQTIQGQRRRRLEHLAEKEKAAENERLRQDAEWDAQLSRERQDKIAKARMMQYMNTPQVRSLHEKMLMANVLYERELQIAHKKKLAQQFKAYDTTPGDQICHTIKQEMEEAEKADQVRLERVALSMHHRNEAERRKEERRKERLAEKEYYATLGNSLAQEVQQEKQQGAIRRHQQILETRRTLKQSIQEKQDGKMGLEEENKRLTKDNESFLNMKAYMASCKKKVAEDKLIHMENLTQHVAETSRVLYEEKEKERLQFLEKSEMAVQGRVEQKQAADREYRQKILQDCVSHRKMMRQINEAEKENLKQMALQERLVLEKASMEAKQEAAVEATRTKKGLMDLRAFHSKQMDEKRKTSKENQDREKAFEKAMIETNEAEQLKFKDYSNQVVLEFSQGGRSIEPIIRGLRQTRSFPPVNHSNQQMDTFERLGFTVRHVPTFPAELDPWKY